MAAASVPTPAGGPLSRNILSVIAAQGLTLVLLLVVGRGLFRSLGGEAFGLITFSSTVATGLAGVLDLGTTSTEVRELAVSRSDADYVTRVVRTGSMVCWIAYVLSALGVLWISPLRAVPFAWIAALAAAFAGMLSGDGVCC